MQFTTVNNETWETICIRIGNSNCGSNSGPRLSLRLKIRVHLCPPVPRLRDPWLNLCAFDVRLKKGRIRSECDLLIADSLPVSIFLNGLCSLPNDIHDEIRVGQHRDMIAINRMNGCTHALGCEPLQIRMNRPVIVGHNKPGGL